MKRLKTIISGIIWTFVLVYLAIIVLAHIPPVQAFIGSQVSNALEHKLGTRVSIGKVNLGFLNRIIIDDVVIFDQNKERMLSATRLSAKFDYLPLTQGRIAISSAQLFGLNANLYKTNSKAQPNYQFLLDSLASKDTTQHKPLDLAIRSLIIRRGQIAYRQRDIASQQGVFSTTDLQLSDLSTHVMLECLRDDSININMKSFAVKDKSGLRINQLRFHFVANKQQAQLSHFKLLLPHSILELGPASMTYSFKDRNLQLPSLQYECSVLPSRITPSDLTPLFPFLKSFVKPVSLTASFHGTSTTLNVSKLSLSSPSNSLNLQAQGSISNIGSTPHWAVQVQRFSISDKGMEFIAENLGAHFNVPAIVTRLGNISFIGNLGGYGTNFASKGIIKTSAGTANIALGIRKKNFSGRIETNGINLQQILADDHLGMLATRINVDGRIPNNSKFSWDKLDIVAKGNIQRFDYNGYSYSNLTVDGLLHQGIVNGSFAINDPNITADVQGQMNLKRLSASANVTVNVERLNPNALKLTNKYPNTVFSFQTKADFSGYDFSTVRGTIDINGFHMQKPQDSYSLDKLHLQAFSQKGVKTLRMESDFGDFVLAGHFDYSTLPQTIANLIGSKLPTLPGLRWNRNRYHNDFSLQAYISKSDWLNQLFNIPLILNEPLNLSADINERQQRINLFCDMPDFSYSGSKYEAGSVNISTPNDTLMAEVSVRKVTESGRKTNLNIHAKAADNKLHTLLSFNNNAATRLQGSIDAETQFFKNERSQNAAHINIHPSEILFGDTAWTIEPADIIYSKNRLLVDHLSLAHEGQHLTFSGLATPDNNDTLFVDFQDVNVAYILDLVNFDAVSFDGLATGRGHIAAAFGRPEASARLRVDNFLFNKGRMGVLNASVGWNRQKEQIEIYSTAKDTMLVAGKVTERQTGINGWVSPKRNDIRLDIDAHNTRGEFLENFCSSFMDDSHINTNGRVSVVGPLNEINLIGKLVLDGDAIVTPLNCRYTLCHDTIYGEPDRIAFRGDTLRDDQGGYGLLSGALHHHNLSHLTYDFDIDANNLRVYDWDGKDGSSFYGSVFGTGKCGIKGGNGNVDIDIDITPNKGSEVVYDASSPTSIENNDFIHWQSRDSDTVSLALRGVPTEPIDIPSDIHVNFLIHTNPTAALRVIMDKTSGDYILLRGDGTLRATYFNKGAVNVFGNYNIVEGIYKLTIQNIIRRQFEFQQGSTIVFGGSPNDARLNLNAMYVVNGVSLSDLNLGNSFSSNNIRVNCLMNITGTPAEPLVSFDMDMPTVSNDVKQMIISIINSEEEKNQQVLYLLAVGRFYSQGVNNSVAENSIQQSQTSLAMQSILSGQISQQINNVLSTVINNANWNFGANISTGDEGWNNAEYEGLVSGRMFNNRLLFNGQFGYRDNANATTSFIGDFDIRYLLKPNGNFAVRFYNQTNDRYFTRNSLNTQGVGIILKKDFNSFRDLFGIKRKNKQDTKKEKSTNKK
ncbi:MAG: translocation/assembly module TamB domain-containing protein [Prevotella sp.]